MDLNQYLSVFIEEAKDHLQAMNDNLLQLENNPTDISIVQVIFRSAHTLKGMSATMGFEDIASLTHKMENVLDMIRNEELSVSTQILDTMFSCADALESMVADIIGGGTGSADVSGLVARLKAIVEGEPAPQQAAAAAVTAGGLNEFERGVLLSSLAAGMQVYRIRVDLRSDCLLKAVRAYMVFQVLESKGEVAVSDPPAEEIEKENFETGFTVYLISDQPAAVLQMELENVSEVDRVVVEALDEALLSGQAPAARQEAQEELQAATDQTAAAATAAAPAPPAPPAPKPVAAKAGAAPVQNRSIRVDIEKLDTLMNLFSELLIDRVRLEQLAREVRHSDLTDTVEHMSRVSSDLQNLVLKLRMVQVDTVFNRFPRMVRDIAKNLGKKIDFVITGADTELDRTLIDEIGDPLVHLLRNALDHGVETPDKRAAAGKPETGTIQLRAYHSGNHVFIEIEDDGNGIHREKVLKTALNKGIITKEQADKMSDAEAAMLLFASGFSTAEQISDISGRGVGLDVVKTKIESLGGHVTVQTKQGVGTIFSVQLPLTMSIIAAMLISVGGEKYAIPLSSIVETAIVKPEAIRTVHGNAMLDYRGSVIPVLSLREVLEIPGEAPKSKNGIELLVIRKGDKLAAVLVDGFIGQQEIVLKSLGAYLTNLFAISGATILGDGQVALILDTNALFK
ncbi:chemotaxis protein CheA [Paenibacillus sp. J31TS4]|uniref:chemotaxis protein CheA n=1 Tax=Paenibacillus sp. J31TS4 TaxID=2807195 RepID=UPI001AFE73D2|nr:chemotaxis protein CheA [Paenibacillus sp. J31TS4]GIP36832.1 chemotaxis protein CheA [Paenibacillus sp. J31TS4]